MSEFILQGDGDHGHTLVSNLFLDNYMPEANGEYVKIYLYLLRCLKSDTQELSIELIANKFENTESDVRRALKYWERMKLLKLQYDNAENLTGIQIVNEPEAKMAELPAADCAVTTRSKPAADAFRSVCNFRRLCITDDALRHSSQGSPDPPTKPSSSSSSASSIWASP